MGRSRSTTKTPPPTLTLELGTSLLIPHDRIVPDPEQPRTEFDQQGLLDLAESIATDGLIEPIVVRATPDLDPPEGDSGEWWTIIAGERRWRAIGLLVAAGRYPADGNVQCMVRNDLTGDSLAMVQLLENLHRVDLDPIEEAFAFLRLTRDYGLAQNELAQRVGRSDSYVSDRLKLVTLCDEGAAALRKKEITLSMAGVVANIVDQDMQRRVLKKGFPNDYQVHSFVRQETNKQRRNELEKAAKKTGTPVVKGDKPASWSTIAVFETTDEMAQRMPAKVPNDARIYVVLPEAWSSTGGKPRAILAKPMTEKQLEKARSKDEAERAKLRERHEREREEAHARSMAKLDPEVRAWMEECDRLRSEHEQADAEYRAARRRAETDWAMGLPAKTVARWALMQVVSQIDVWSAVRHFGLDQARDITSYDDAKEAVARWVSDSATNMTTAAAWFLARGSYGMGFVGEAKEHLDTYLRLAELVAPELALPPKPGADPTVMHGDDGEEHLDPDDEFYDEEQAAMEQVRRQLDNDVEPESVIDTPDIDTYDPERDDFDDPVDTPDDYEEDMSDVAYEGMETGAAAW